MWIKNIFLLFSAFVPADHCSRRLCISGHHRCFCADDRENEDKENIMLYENMIILGEYWEISWSFIR